MRVLIVRNDSGSPVGKLADAELHFDDGPLEGLKLIGFAVWQKRAGDRAVTFPSRQYSVNGERRSYALLRPLASQGGQDRIREVVLQAFVESEPRDHTG